MGLLQVAKDFIGSLSKKPEGNTAPTPPAPLPESIFAQQARAAREAQQQAMKDVKDGYNPPAEGTDGSGSRV